MHKATSSRRCDPCRMCGWGQKRARHRVKEQSHRGWIHSTAVILIALSRRKGLNYTPSPTANDWGLAPWCVQLNAAAGAATDTFAVDLPSSTSSPFRAREKNDGTSSSYDHRPWVPRTSMVTSVVPARMKPRRRAARRVTLISLPLTNGPRSVTRTTTLLLFLTFVNFTLVPKGNERWAAVKLLLLKRCPLAVRRPL